MAARALAPIFTRSYKPASAPPPFRSAGGRPWEDLSLKLKADKPHHAVQGLLPEGDQLASLPLELLLLICEYASLGTLLALSRTTKALRRLLLTRSGSTEALWELVREKEGWPANVDKETSIIRYAHVLDGSECQGYLDERLRVRLCQSCRDNTIGTETGIDNEHPYVHGWAYDCSLSRQEIPDPAIGDIKVTYFEPDVLLQSAHLYRLEALAELCGRSTEDATADYVDLRLGQIVEMNEQIDLIEEQVDLLAEADQADEMRSRLFHAQLQLEALGYKPADYGDLTDNWWTKTFWWVPAEPDERFERWWVEPPNYFGDWDDDDWVEWEREQDEAYDNGEFEEEVFEEEDRWDDEAEEMASIVEAYFIGGEYEDVDWDDIKLWVVTYVHRRSLPRRRAELEQRRAERFDKMRPLADQVLALLPPSLHRIVPSFGSIAMLPTVTPFWFADSAVVDPSTWSASHPAILADVLRSIRLLKLRLFSRIAHTLPSTSLPPHVALTLSSELVNADPHHAPLHNLLSDADMDPILARPSALLRCGVCSTKLVYPHIVEHLRDEHGASAAPCAAWACAPDERFGEAVRALLEGDQGLDDETTDEELRGMGVVFEVDEEIAGGHVLHSLESWEQLTSGWHAEDPDAYCYKLDSSHDRRIVGIRLAR